MHQPSPAQVPCSCLKRRCTSSVSSTTLQYCPCVYARRRAWAPIGCPPLSCGLIKVVLCQTQMGRLTIDQFGQAYGCSFWPRSLWPCMAQHFYDMFGRGWLIRVVLSKCVLLVFVYLLLLKAAAHFTPTLSRSLDSPRTYSPRSFRWFLSVKRWNLSFTFVHSL
jgi:hypothetical protein